MINEGGIVQFPIESTKIQSIKNIKEFNEIITNKSNIVIVELYTPWCSKCKKLEANIQSAKLDHIIYKINIDADPFIDDTRFEEIKSLPCIWIYKNNKRIDVLYDDHIAQIKKFNIL